MTVSMLLSKRNNVGITTTAIIEDTKGRILHNGNNLTVKPEIMKREICSFTVNNDTLYIMIF